MMEGLRALRTTLGWYGYWLINNILSWTWEPLPQFLKRHGWTRVSWGQWEMLE